MKIISLFVFGLLAFFSCKKLSPLERLIHDADVVKVYVYSGNTLAMHYETNDIEKIQRWKSFIADDSASTSSDCLQEGKIIFKTSEDSTVMKFSLKPSCRYMSYEFNGIQYSKTLTESGRKYIDSLMRVQ